jgi:hypothetical protein
MINLNDFIIEKLKVSTNTDNGPWEWEPTSEVVDYYDLHDLLKTKGKYDLLNFLSEDELPKFKPNGYIYTIRWVGLNHKNNICVFAYIYKPEYYTDYEVSDIASLQSYLACEIEKRKIVHNHDKGHAMVVKIYHDLLDESNK